MIDNSRKSLTTNTGQSRPMKARKMNQTFRPAPPYATAWELMQTVRFGNSLAKKIDAANNVQPGFRFEAAVRHMLHLHNRHAAVNLAIALHPDPRNVEVPKAIDHVNMLAKTKPSYNTTLPPA